MTNEFQRFSAAGRKALDGPRKSVYKQPKIPETGRRVRGRREMFGKTGPGAVVRARRNMAG